jgi:hypothetical protein
MTTTIPQTDLGIFDRRVDDAGYLMHTGSYIHHVAQSLADLADRGVQDEQGDDIFGEPAPSTKDRRAAAARLLRQHARHLIKLAEQLEGPQVDESESPLVGYDAAHSVF